MKRDAWNTRSRHVGRVAIPAALGLLATLTAVCLLLLPATIGDPARADACSSSPSPVGSTGEGWGGGSLYLVLELNDAPPLTPTPTTVPFLYPPFANGYRITSYVDHLSPDYGWDDTVVIYSGEQAHAIDGIWKRTPTFRGGYWQPESERLLYYDGHGGVDYATPLGTTVLAAAPGEVVFAGSAYSGCETPLLYVALAHEGGYRTYYVHLDGVSVRAGQRVQAGDPVGISGNSGCSTGPHLHFGVEHEGRLTDAYGWQTLDRPDPLLAAGGTAATWLWAAGAPPTTPLTHTLTGRLTTPRPNKRANGDLLLTFEPDPGCPSLSRVEFWAYHTSTLDDDGEAHPRWHRVGVDRNGQDGWSLRWNTRRVPEGPVWLHAWAVDETGRVGKGSPILDSVTVDRHPPLGRLVGLLPGGTAGRRLWLYVTAEDPETSASSVEPSDIRQVDLLARPSLRRTSGPSIEQSVADWTEIGQARWLHGSEWLLLWEPAGSPLALVDAAAPHGAVIDLAARLTDRAGNSALTEPVEGIVLDDRAPLGQVDHPLSGVPLTTTVDLVFVPSATDAPASAATAPAASTAALDQVAFWAWYDQKWQMVGTDTNGRGGWQVRWDPADVDDQVDVRVQARPQVEDQIYTALPQVTGLILDRTPPNAGYIRPRTQGVAHPDVAQRVWARDEGSGVARVEFYIAEGEDRTQIGEDDRAEDDWSLAWDAEGVPDGLVDLIARVYDRAGNTTWTEVQREVALDRGAPIGAMRVEPSVPLPAVPAGRDDGATHTLFLDVTDEVSGLDRAVFYAHLDGGWRHLGVDGDPKNGLRLRWDSASLGASGPVTFTAWVYDRAGNHVELEHVRDIGIKAAEESSPTATTGPEVPSTPTLTPTRRVETPTATLAATQAPLSPVATATPTSLIEGTAAPTATATVSSTATAIPTAVASVTEMPPPGARGPVGPRGETLIAVGVLVALLMFLVVMWMLTRSWPR